ncbi:hypothetical protein GOP47_0002070 [Adiantum capillus-veneris]|uniref:Uncharacterized protein n=1 Tax=Adiantum capillus-veneris TaxID=13818 RepID=A0A9D4ZQV4_ADICA|nr:hypothetical protein GOP47_0030743 [Adiantum capillus-veneris]KAI5082327.1 hypothetical protein GOP47_0002070 [Adiantum capillus-veneris]
MGEGIATEIEGTERESSCAAGEITARSEGAGSASTQTGAIAGEWAAMRFSEEAGVGERGDVDKEEVLEP